MKRRIKAWLFREGRYPDHGVPQADEAFLRDYAERTNAHLAAGEQVPFNIEHFPTERVFDFAQLVPGSVRVERGKPPQADAGEAGAWITADVDIEPSVDDGLKARGLSVLLDLGRRIVEHVTVTETPRVGAAAFSQPDKEHCIMSLGKLSHAAFNAAGGAAASQTTTDPPGGGDAAQQDGTPPGAIAWLRKMLGFGDGQGEAAGGQGAQVAPAFSAGAAASASATGAEAQADDAFMSDPRVKALIGHFEQQVTALSAKVASAETQAQTAFSTTQDQVIEARTAAFKAAGVPPWLVDTLVPVAFGRPKVTVAFSDADGKPQVKEVDAAGAALHVLETMQGAVPFSRKLPVDDDRKRPFSDDDQRAAARAEAIKRENPKLSIAECQRMADAELASA